MDLTFNTKEGNFNYRSAAVILSNNKLLVMKDDKSAHYYLPGGRVRFNERADDALSREIKEEIGINA